MDSPSARPFVIAIGGTSGSGKSALVKRVASLLGEATTLFFDDYASVSSYPSDIEAWVRDGAHSDGWKTPQFATDLLALRHGQPISPPGGVAQQQPAPYIVVEEPFGRERQEMRAAIDLVAVIDVPLEVALARRIRRDLQSAPKDSATSVEALRSLDQFLEVYLDHRLREAYQITNRRALATCDVVLDGLKPTDELAEQVVQAARAQSSRSRALSVPLPERRDGFGQNAS